MVSRSAGGAWWARICLCLALCWTAGCAEAEPGADLEEPLLGVFHAYVVDQEDGSSREAYALSLDTGEDVELAFQAPPALRSGDRVTLYGRYASHAEALSDRDDLRTGDTRFVVTRAETAKLERADEALLVPPKVTVTNAIILLNFRGQAPQDYTKAAAQADLAKVRAYYEEMSYGSWTMQSDVFGPYEVDAPSRCNLNVLGQLGKQAARARGVDIDGYDHVGVKIAGILGLGCPCGVAYLGATPAQGAIRNGKTSLYTCKGANVFAHELGHGIGLHHASTAPCNGKAYRPGLQGCQLVEYGNRFNAMGNGLGHFSAMQKATLGWLGGCNVRQVEQTGTYELTALQTAAHRSVAQTLQIDTGDTRNGAPLYFYVEYRNPDLAAFNATEPNGVRREQGPGVLVGVSRDYRARGGEGRTILLDASRNLTAFSGNGAVHGDPRLLPGRVLQLNGRVRIELLSQTASVAKVRVTLTGAGGDPGSDACANGVATGEEPAPEPADAGLDADAAAGLDAGVIVDEGDGFADAPVDAATPDSGAWTVDASRPPVDGGAEGEVDESEPPTERPEADPPAGRPEVERGPGASGCMLRGSSAPHGWLTSLGVAAILLRARRRRS